MVGHTKPDSIHKLHIEELQEFLASRDVAFGSPANLQPFADLLAHDEPFAEEMGSLVRSILYQEERLGRAELVGIVTSSVAGDVSDGGTEHQETIRKIFQFVNVAVRQTQPTIGDLPETENDDLILSIEAELEGDEADPQAPAWSPLPVSGQVPAHERSDVLYRAMALSADQETPLLTQGKQQVEFREEVAYPPSRPWWVIPAVGIALAGILAGVYLWQPGFDHRRGERGLIAPSLSSSNLPAHSNSCAAPIAAGATRAGIEERSLWARNLLTQGLYDAALPELREIARLDPGFPGVQLDESSALLHLKRPEEARDAIDAQIAVSECLGSLPPPALEAYCSTQYASPALAGCKLQMTHIRQAAELQAALVHLELGHQAEPDAGAAAALAELSKEEPAPAKVTAVPKSVGKPRRAEPLPPATEGDTAQPPLARAPSTPLPGTKGARDNSLVRGEGTDSVYGAYQKPQ